MAKQGRGNHTPNRDVIKVLELNSQRLTSGKFLWTIADIGREVDLDNKTVRMILRSAAAELYRILQEHNRA